MSCGFCGGFVFFKVLNVQEGQLRLQETLGFPPVYFPSGPTQLPIKSIKDHLVDSGHSS